MQMHGLSPLGTDNGTPNPMPRYVDNPKYNSLIQHLEPGTREETVSEQGRKRIPSHLCETGKLVYGNLALRRPSDIEKPHQKIPQITTVNGGDNGLDVL
ncbi:hypothetical protein TNCV_4820071 [Trichonephila clavipes]|nr:hypothetical protein TNCV_4820071 [Trichonephila clavipes]